MGPDTAAAADQPTVIAADGVEWTVTLDGQDWRICWHPPPHPPPGIPHGSAAVCHTDRHIVLVSDDGHRWGMPGGRPEPGEDWPRPLTAVLLAEPMRRH